MVALIVTIFIVVVPLLFVTFVCDGHTKLVWPMVHVIWIPLNRKYSTHSFTKLVVGSTNTVWTRYLQRWEGSRSVPTKRIQSSAFSPHPTCAATVLCGLLPFYLSPSTPFVLVTCPSWFLAASMALAGNSFLHCWWSKYESVWAVVQAVSNLWLLVLA